MAPADECSLTICAVGRRSRTPTPRQTQFHVTTLFSLSSRRSMQLGGVGLVGVCVTPQLHCVPKQTDEDWASRRDGIDAAAAAVCFACVIYSHFGKQLGWKSHPRARVAKSLCTSVTNFHINMLLIVPHALYWCPPADAGLSFSPPLWQIQLKQVAERLWRSSPQRTLPTSPGAGDKNPNGFWISA